MATAERDVLINVRVSEEERAKLHAIADAADEPAAQTIRRFIRQRYAADFGDVPPASARAKAKGR
jgi:hypothetical protein